MAEMMVELLKEWDLTYIVKDEKNFALAVGGCG